MPLPKIPARDEWASASLFSVERLSWATAGIVIIAVVFSRMNGWEFSVGDAMQTISAVGLLWGIWYAAENLQHMRDSEERQGLPLLYPRLQMTEESGANRRYSLVIHNLGKGAIVAPRGRAWAVVPLLDDSSSLDVKPMALRFSDAILKGDEQLKADVEFDGWGSVMVTNLVVEIQYERVGVSEEKKFWHFKEEGNKLSDHPLITAELAPPIAGDRPLRRIE